MLQTLVSIVIGLVTLGLNGLLIWFVATVVFERINALKNVSMSDRIFGLVIREIAFILVVFIVYQIPGLGLYPSILITAGLFVLVFLFKRFNIASFLDRKTGVDLEETGLVALVIIVVMGVIFSILAISSIIGNFILGLPIASGC